MIWIIILIVIITISILLTKKYVINKKIFEYNVNCTPYVNIFKLTNLTVKNEKATKLIKKLLKKSLKYSSSKKFYNDVLIKHKSLFYKNFNIDIVKCNKPIDFHILSIGYLKSDKVNTVLYKMLMKLKLVYGLDYTIKDMKTLVDDDCTHFIHFDQFINCNKLKNILELAFGFKFIIH